MSFIEVNNINKSFKVAKRGKGFLGTLKAFIRREYRIVEAVKDVSFTIDKGEIVGYIGPNGAGKSTTIKMLSGILIPDSGTIKIDKMIPSVNRNKYVSKIGVVFGQRSQLWWDIPAIDVFDLLKDIYNIDEKQYEKTKNELITMLKLEEIVNVPVRQLSLGERMRCEIVASLLHKPEILFLDEPTIGLDAISKEIVRDFIKKINKEEQTTIILTTHDMSDIDSLAKRIILIGKGRILYDGPLSHLKHKYGNCKSVIITTKEHLPKVNKKGVNFQKKNSNGYEFNIDANILTISDFLKYLSAKISIDDVEIDNENIDNVIIKVYKEYNL